MSILLSVTGFEPDRWRVALERLAPGREIVTEPGSASDPSIRYAVVWKQRPDLLNTLPNLKAIFSIGAGVDHIFRDPNVPHVPVARIVAEDLTTRMSEYVAWRVLDHFRRGMTYRAQQAASTWHEWPQPTASAVTVGILGMGELGRDAAAKLRTLGFSLAGWTRTQKRLEGVQCFHGAEGLGPFLALSDIVVVLLPLTEATRGILDARFFSLMKRETPLGGPVLINAGRGGLQVEADILAALDGDVLMEASLDVFEAEPLPPTSPLWRHPRVFITPHTAATSDPQALAPLIIGQIEAYERGEPLKHLVDRNAGY